MPATTESQRGPVNASEATLTEEVVMERRLMAEEQCGPSLSAEDLRPKRHPSKRKPWPSATERADRGKLVVNRAVPAWLTAHADVLPGSSSDGDPNS